MTVSSVYRALLVCLLQAGSVFFCASATAQHTSEVGFGLGGTNYRGEISPQYRFLNNRPAFTVFYRRDVSVPITLRGAITAGFLSAADIDVPSDVSSPPPLSAFRQASLSGHVTEVSVVVEYNFLDYHNREHKVHFTPYLFAGFAGYSVNTTTTIGTVTIGGPNSQQGGAMLGIAIPAGAGLKYALTEHLNLGLEAGVRKTFTDELDHLGQQDPALVNPHDQDWYYYNGVSLSYTFYKIRCPRQYKRNRDLLE